jgi:hypothetical protein
MLVQRWNVKRLRKYVSLSNVFVAMYWYSIPGPGKIFNYNTQFSQSQFKCGPQAAQATVK